MSNTFPAIRPSLLLDFVDSRRLDPRVTFTRSSTATYVGSDGLIKIAAADQPRFDFDPITLLCKGLLVEEARTNLLTYSEQFDTAAWGKANSSITANAMIAPDGTLAADKHVSASGATLGIFFGQTAVSGASLSRTAGVTYAVSVFAKAGEFNSLQIGVIETGNNRTATFNLATGVSVLASGSSATLSMAAVGNGWYRCSVVWTQAVTESASMRFTAYDSVATTGDGVSGVYFWGAQFEAGSFATSYIPTTSAQVTRAADSGVMTGANFTSWYNQSEGSFAAEWTLGSDVTSTLVWQTDDGTSGNLIRLRYAASGLANDVAVITRGTAQASVGVTTQQTFNATYRNAAAYKVNDVARSADGGAVLTGVASTLPFVTRLGIGRNYNVVEQLNGHIRRIAYYPKRLSNTELQALSA